MCAAKPFFPLQGGELNLSSQAWLAVVGCWSGSVPATQWQSSRYRNGIISYPLDSTVQRTGKGVAEWVGVGVGEWVGVDTHKRYTPSTSGDPPGGSSRGTPGGIPQGDPSPRGIPSEDPPQRMPPGDPPGDPPMGSPMGFSEGIPPRDPLGRSTGEIAWGIP